jgi:hypothetical protein
MKRAVTASRIGALLALLCCAGCTDGTTPDCSPPDAGCGPGDDSSADTSLPGTDGSPDAPPGDAPADTHPAVDAAGASDAPAG